jgi:hypothetical protein
MECESSEIHYVYIHHLNKLSSARELFMKFKNDKDLQQQMRTPNGNYIFFGDMILIQIKNSIGFIKKESEVSSPEMEHNYIIFAKNKISKILSISIEEIYFHKRFQKKYSIKLNVNLSGLYNKIKKSIIFKLFKKNLEKKSNVIIMSLNNTKIEIKPDSMLITSETQDSMNHYSDKIIEFVMKGGHGEKDDESLIQKSLMISI